MIFVVALLVGVEVFFFILLAMIFIKRNQSVDVFHRLRRHIDTDADKQKNFDLFKLIVEFIQRMAKPLEKFGIIKILDFRMRQAGIPLYGAEFIVLMFVSTFLISGALYVITLNAIIVPIVIVIVPILLWYWTIIAANRRKTVFTNQLGDCLTTVANALRAGYSFQQAMDVVAREMEPPISTEFAHVSTDIAMGVSLEEALEQMNKRVASSDFDLVVTAVLIQREVGGNLAQILDTISYTINERIRMKREITALTAQGRFSAWVLIILPFAVAAFCWIFNHDQMLLFVTEESGRYALAGIIIMEIVGFFVIQKIVDIEV